MIKKTKVLHYDSLSELQYNVLPEVPGNTPLTVVIEWEVVPQKKTMIVTNAKFIGKDIGGCSQEWKLVPGFFNGRTFTKITFEWEE